MTPLVLRIARGTLRAELAGRGWAAEAEYHSPEDISAAVAQLVEEIPGSPQRRGMTLLVEPPLAQVRRLYDLPSVGSEDLRAMVAMQAGRFFRKNGAALVTDALWLSRRSGNRVALAVAVEAPVVDLVVAAAREAGVDVVGATVSGPGRLTELSLLPGGIRLARERAARSGLRRLGVVVLAAWILLASAYALMIRLERGKVDRERTSLAGGVAALSGLRREVRGAEQMLTAVETAERTRGQVLSQVGRLVSALPDSAFLSSLMVSRDGAGLISGRAIQASEVLAALTRTAAAPHFEGPILKEPGAGRQWEGFTIRFGAAPQ